jgi:hypothetical protein
MVISLISKQTCLGLAKTQVFVPLFIICEWAYQVFPGEEDNLKIS